MYQERSEHREASPPDTSYATPRDAAHPAPVDGPYTLIGPDGLPYRDTVKGILGGNRHDRIYGRLTCRAAAQAIQRGGYTASRVFFASEADAIAAGYRPCAVCLPYTYAYWLRGPHDTP
jgi:hypothetical protein